MIESTTPFKRCKCCQRELPLTEFHKNKKSKDGYLNLCKSCRTLRGELNARHPIACEKTCSVCGQTLPLESFHKFALGKYGRQSECKECACKRVHGYLVEHRPERAEYTRNYYRQHKDSVSAYYRLYRHQNREKINHGLVRWRKTNPLKFRLRKEIDRSKRRSREANAEGHHSSEDVLRQYQKQDGKCFWCNCPVDSNYHIDHVIPLSRGGTNWPANIVISCAACNLSKGAKTPDEWRASRD